MVLEELVDFVHQELTVGCMLPAILPEAEIKRLIQQRALPYFYKNYSQAVTKVYYYVPMETFQTEEFTKYKYITLPCDIEAVVWIYETLSKSLFQMGLNAPNLAVNYGSTNIGYTNAYLSTIGELGVYKTVIDGFADVMNQMTKTTYKYHHNRNNHRLNILTDTSVLNSMVLEVYAHIEPESLFEDEIFQRYVAALAKKQLATLLGRYNFNMPGGIQYNYSDISSTANDEYQAVIDEIKAMSTVTFFRMVKR